MLIAVAAVTALERLLRIPAGHGGEAVGAAAAAVTVAGLFAGVASALWWVVQKSTDMKVPVSRKPTRRYAAIAATL